MSNEELEIVGGSLAELRRAAALAREGRKVTLVEPALRAGGRYVTESFLTPFRFNLGPALVSRSVVDGVGLLEPDPLVAVDGAALGRAPITLAPASTVWETLDVGALDPDRRNLLAALAILLGLDPDARGSGAALVRAAAQLDDLVAVRTGNGAIAARLLDELVADGGRVVEGVGPERMPKRRSSRTLGTCRLFVGLRRRHSQDAFATAVGFTDADSLCSGLAELRRGSTMPPLGFVIDNTHLDPNRPGDPLASFVWQGILPFSTSVSRRDYTTAVLKSSGVDPEDVLFALLWLPREANEPLNTTPTPLRD